MIAPTSTSRQSRLGAACVGLSLAISACEPVRPPPTREVLRLEGSAYERGLQHGRRLKSKIRSFYTTLLLTSILPHLNREQPDLAAVFPEYRKGRYAGGRFSFELLLDSARSFEKSISRAHRDEMRGVADGAEVPYEQVLVLNTFVDALLAIRAVALTARLSGAPELERVDVLGVEADGVDNDGDGAADEEGEGTLAYQALPHAALVELPRDARFRLVLRDPDGVDPATLRLTLEGEVFDRGSGRISAQPRSGDETRLEVTFTPPPLPSGRFSLVVQAGDRSLVTEPPPAHARFMRDERITFTTRGTALAPAEVDNRGPPSPRPLPPAYAFAARGSFTADGAPVLAQHFALFDGNTAHKHTAVFVHHPDSGPPFAVVGWAGVIWGTSGMNGRGLAGACNPSDTLDNSVVQELFAQLGDLENAKLVASGQPMGFLLRTVLERDGVVAEAIDRARLARHGFGWSCLFADGAGALRAVEVDSNISKDGGVFDYGPGDVDESGRRWASIGPDDLRVASHFRRNADDLSRFTVAGQRVMPQRGFSTFYFRSVDAWSRLGEALVSRRGRLDADRAEELLREPALVNGTDSMNAVVYEPGSLKLRAAMGTVLATASTFETVSLEAP